MKKRMILQPLAAGILASLLMATPLVYAEVTVSQPIDVKNVAKASNAEQADKAIAKAKEVKQQEEAATKKATSQAQAAASRANTLLSEEAVQKVEQQIIQSENKVKPFIGTLATKVSLVGDTKAPKEEVLDLLKLKAGAKITAEGFDGDLRSLYESGWFYEINPTFVAVPEGTQINYNVIDNPVFEQLDVEGNTKIATDKIRSIMDLKQGDILNTKKVNEGARKVESEYSQQGYILAKVGDIRMLPDGHLAMAINEGIVEGFKIKGNTKTKDYVVVREMRLKKGEPFNAKAARRSMQKIYNLGYFEDVNIKLNPGQTPGGVEVEITVVEMSTGTFGIGAGYSDADGFLGMVNIGDKNFRGTGDKIDLRWEFGGSGSNNKNYEFSYTKPWIDKKGTTAGLTIYNMTNEYVDYNRDGDEIARYDKKRVGQELTFSRVTDDDNITNYMTLKNRDDKYEGPESGYATQYYEGIGDGKKNTTKNYGPAVAAERQAANFGTSRSITIGRVLDSRDNIYDPRDGKRTNYSIEVASFGGDFNYQKYSADYRYYYRVGADNVWAWNIAAGYANGDMPLAQRYSVGGSDTLRGFRDNQFRGNSMFRTSLEFRVPIVKKVQGVFFTDAGYAWDKNLYDEKDFDFSLMKYSVGIGLRVNSPLGPLRFDYGIPLKDGNGNRFHFSFGGQF